MNIDGQHYRTIWLDDQNSSQVNIIDQRFLPHELRIEALRSLGEAAAAIREMHVRGAPLIGVTAAYGMYIAALQCEAEDYVNALRDAAQQLKATRPTAVNLAWAVDQQLAIVATATSLEEATSSLLQQAHRLADESVERCRQIGQCYQNNPSRPVHLLTHCNAGWMACIDYGTATSPIYAAHDKGIPVHVWVDETRPRNQGARITAFELLKHGVPHTVITDNTGGHLMQHGMVDLVIVGSDRTTRTGDVANKIGTYLKALAAKDNDVPFYVALPSSSIDWNMRDGVKEIPIEERHPDEVRYIQGKGAEGITRVLLTPEGSPAANYGFDTTPARLVSGLITERGVCEASEAALTALFPEQESIVKS